MTFPPVSLLFFLCGMFLVILGLYAWRQPSTTGARMFTLFVFAAAIHSLGYTMELASPNVEVALFWSKVQYLGILSFPTLYLFFIIQFTGRGRWLTTPRIVALLALPALMYVVKLFDQNLHWIYSSAEMVQVNSLLVLQFTRGPVYFAVNIYILLVVTVANYLLFEKLRMSSGLYHRQTVLMFLGAMLVYLLYLLYFVKAPLPAMLQGLDFNPLAYTIWAACISLAISRYRLLDLAPIARDALIEMLSDGVVVLDAQTRVVDANPEARRIFGWIQLPIGHSAQQAMGQYMDLSFLDDLPKSTKIENSIPKKRSRTYYETTFSVLRNEHGQKIGYLVLIHDITDRKEIEMELEDLSLQDELTGLANRRGFNVLATQAISMATRMHLNAAIFYVDIDGLKRINDTLGHATGDAAIKDVASILRSAFRSSDIIARMGGDEFTVLALESQSNSAEIMQRHLENAIAEYSKQSRSYTLSFSAGLTHYRWNKPKTLEALLASADRDMYKVKKTKKSKSGPSTTKPKNNTAK